MAQAPRAFNRGLHSNRDQVFYGTDDGSQDGSFGEFPDFIKHYESVDQSRKDDIHMISVVGGLYGLNMIPLWKPKKLTIFDINPMGVTYFTVIHRVWTTSNDAQHFLQRLEDMDYEVVTEDEKFVQENISLKSKGTLPRSRGSSKRSFYESWKYALDNFEVTKSILLGPLEIRTEPMESDSFSDMIKNQNNSWIYASNITQFHFFDLDFEDPSNCVMLQIIHPEKPQLLDISEYAGKRVRVKFAIPITVEELG